MSMEQQGTVDLSGSSGGVPERFVPEEMHGQLVEAEHVIRYGFSARFASGRRVLDAGCGVGYGAAMLAEQADRVTAIDIAEAVIDVARGQVPGVDFHVGDLHSLPFEDRSFDLVVCFEAIEHVDDPERVLDELTRVLAPGGILLVSSPNRDRYVPGNPHHRHEYRPEELKGVLERRLPEVHLLQQHVMTASVLGAADGVGPPDVSRFVEPGAADETYTVAMAAERLPEPGGPMVGLTGFAEVRRLVEHIESQDELIVRQREELEALRAAGEARAEALRMLADREQELAELPSLRLRLERADEQLSPLARRGDIGVDGLIEQLERSEQALRDLRRSRVVRLAVELQRLRARLGR